jgi:hypothetical protein
MAIGNDSEFSEAWRDLRETFVRKLAREYYGIDIDEIGIRAYDMTMRPLAVVLNDIRQKNIIKSIIFRAGRRIRIVFRGNHAH